MLENYRLSSAVVDPRLAPILAMTSVGICAITRAEGSTRPSGHENRITANYTVGRLCPYGLDDHGRT